MMGVGKSTIGKALSKQLSMEFIDIDHLIEKRVKLTIQKIFEQKGESFFRKLEEKMTIEEMQNENKIISLGGGAFMNKKIRDYVLSHSKSFWLNINMPLLAKRLINSKKRPLLNNKNIKLTLEKIYSERRSVYSLANYKVDCNSLNTNLIVNKIAKLYEND